MAKYIPASFNANRVSDGLYKAMGFGEPTRVADKATFYFVTETRPQGPVDQDNVSFDPEVRTQKKVTSKQVPCAIEFQDRSDKIESFGVVSPSRIQITLLDYEYQQVKEFKYVVVGGDKYIYHSTEPPNALGTIDVWTVWATAEDER